MTVPEDTVTAPDQPAVEDLGSPRAVLLAGGGTAGHVNPLLSVAEELRARDPELRIAALGTAEGLESRLVPERGIELFTVPKVPMPRRPTPDWFRLPRRLRAAVDAAGEAIDTIGAQAVVGFGGYVATPAYLAARNRGLPVVIHEQNARPGLANRLGARWAASVAVTFPGTRLPGAVVTGLPLRPEILDLLEDRAADLVGTRRRAAAELGIDPTRPVLLVTGGSLGALSINTAVAAQASAVLGTGAEVLHLTGAGKADAVRAAVRGVPGAERYHVREYLGEMEQALAIADLVLCRSGAGTVSELAALGIPAVYVPLPVGNGEQKLNAQPVVAAGGGLLVADDDLTPEWFAEHLVPLLKPHSAGRREQMGQAAATIGVPDAARQVADLVEDALAVGAQRLAELADDTTHDDATHDGPTHTDDLTADTSATDPGDAATDDLLPVDEEAADPAIDATTPSAPTVPDAAPTFAPSTPDTAPSTTDAAPSDPASHAPSGPAVTTEGTGNTADTVAMGTVSPAARIDPADPTTFGTVHLIGIGGAGMSAIAGLLADRGLAVQGSDAQEGPAVAGLRAAGITVLIGHDAAHLDGVDTVVVSSAIRETNPELARARALDLPVLHRSQALAALMDDRISVVVAGAHGKTTTSAMAAAALTAVGRRDAVLDPSYAIGATIRTEAGPLPGHRTGTGQAFVAEADESDGSFLNYRPAVAVITNIEPDHLDHYGTVDAFEQAFVDFTERIRPGGALVVCADDPGVRRLLERTADDLTGRGVRMLTYGRTGDVDLLLGETVEAPGGVWRTPLTSALDGLPGATLDLRVPGDHNAADAAAAYLAAWAAGADVVDTVQGLAEFRGTGRRFEDRGTARDIRVVDDYAHHPTEVAALLRTARTVVGDGRVLVLFQPHLFSRTRTFASEFAAALDLADLAVVTDVYAAREDPDPEVSGDTIVRQAIRPETLRFVADREEAAREIARAAAAGDLVLTVGAGDVTALGAVILAELAAEGDTAPESSAAPTAPTAPSASHDAVPENAVPENAVPENAVADDAVPDPTDRHPDATERD
ncbi:UDP-N-acetylmuramate--L-alanine ligase [Cellulomonas taurus]|uniref:UDP-N-acetylmuramate--L-alanine ligase n=1 Tax=Cellulomonas taurus TaxID=2729175 RepID=UPI0031B5E93D